MFQTYKAYIRSVNSSLFSEILLRSDFQKKKNLNYGLCLKKVFLPLTNRISVDIAHKLKTVTTIISLPNNLYSYCY